MKPITKQQYEDAVRLIKEYQRIKYKEYRDVIEASNIVSDWSYYIEKDIPIERLPISTRLKNCLAVYFKNDSEFMERNPSVSMIADIDIEELKNTRNFGKGLMSEFIMLCQNLNK